jgi:preprotein translocase subunit SecB
MAKTSKAKGGNGANETERTGAPSAPAGQGTPAPASGPTISVLAQYIKDFSFENPNAPNSLRPREQAPSISININVNANPLNSSDFEVTLALEAKAAAGADVVFNAELLYAGIFRMQGIPQEQMHPALLIECPRLLFPFARHVIADATRNGGFPPLMIDPVDFSRLYQSRLAEMQAKQAKTAN